MKTMKKSVSLLLTVIMLAVCVCLPMTVSAADAYTVEKETTLTRFVPATKSFTAGETKSFEFTADTTAEYALFTMSGGSNRGTTVFAVTEKESGDAVPFTYRENSTVAGKFKTGDTYAHAHYASRQYERVGNIDEVKVSLTAGKDYVLSLSREEALAQFNYVDLRCLTLPIVGGNQEISPADFSTFNSTTSSHVTEQFDYTTFKLSSAEYNLIGNYNDSSVFSSPYEYVRSYMISAGSTATYKLDVQKEAYYRIRYKTTTWKSSDTIKEGSVHSFNVPFAVDDTTVNTLTYSYTAPSDGAKLEAQTLSSDVFLLTEGEHVLSFGPAGTPGAYAYGIFLEEVPDYDPDAIHTIVIDKAPVKVDNVLSRFEFDEALQLSAMDDIYQMSFTPTVTGEYVVFLTNNTSAANDLNISVSDSKDAEVYNVTRTLKNNSYIRFGDNQYTAIPMTAGETYTITLSGVNNPIAVSYMDLRLVNALPVPTEGKFMISPSDYSATTIGSSHMSQQFNAIAYTNADYPLIGDYMSSSLKTPRKSTTTIHHGNGTVVSYTLDIQKAGAYQFTIPTPTTYPGTAKKEQISMLVNGGEYDVKGWEEKASDLVFDACYLAEGINVISFKNLTVPYELDGEKINGSQVGAYVKAILCEPVAEANTNVIVSGSTDVDSVIPIAKATSINGNFVYNQAGYHEAYAGASISYEIDVEETGMYSVYVNALIPQQGVNITVDGVDRTSYAYDDKAQKENVSASYLTVHDKKLSYPVELTAGKHTVTLTFKNGLAWKDNAIAEITDADNFASKLYKIWVRRVDLTASETETVYLRSWDFISESCLNEAEESSNCPGWLFPHQYSQGGTANIGNFVSNRNVVFINSAAITYRINAPKAGYYTITAYIGVTEGNENTFTVTTGDKTYNGAHVGTGKGDAGADVTGVYLEKGANDVTFKAPVTCNGTMRLFGISVTTENTEFVKVDTISATVSVKFDAAYSGTALVALYNADNALVGLKTEVIENADYYAAEVDITAAPTKAKVMVWKDTATTLAPLCDAILITSTDENWK